MTGTRGLLTFGTLAALLLTLSACDVGVSSPSPLANQATTKAQETDYTADFLGTVGDKVYTRGPLSLSSETQNKISISRSGVIQQRTMGAECSYDLIGKVDSVTRMDSTHYMLSFTNTEVRILPDSKGAECKALIEKMYFQDMSPKQQRLICGYSQQMIDFSCNGKQDSVDNWNLAK